MRVFELAKDLGMDQKDLLRHLLDMGVNVSNNMSLLSPEDMQMVRERIGGERAEASAVEQQRVTTRVIRRRRKKSAHPGDADGDMADSAEPEEGEPDEQPARPTADAPVQSPVAASTEPAAAPEPAPEPEPRPRVVAEPAPVTASEQATPAVAPSHDAPPIQAVAASVEPESEPKAVQEKPEVVAVSEAKHDPQPEPQPAPEPASAPRAVESAEQAAPVAEKPAEPKPGAAKVVSRPRPEQPPLEDRSEQGPRPPKKEVKIEARDKPKKKRRFEDEPARIISRPSPEAPPPPPASAPHGQRPDGPPYGQRPDGPRGPRPDGPPYGQRPSGPRPDGPPYGQRPSGPRPDGAPYGQRPSGPRPDGPRPDGPRVMRPESPRSRPLLPTDKPDADAPPTKTDPTRRRKKARKPGPSLPDDDALLNKAGGRRKQVLDKADLYDSKHRRGKGGKRGKKTELTTPKAIKRRVKVGESIALGELAKRMGIKATEVVAKLLKSGMMVTVNQTLDIEDAVLVAAEFGFEVDRVGFEEECLLERVADQPEDLSPRPPVVTIMGHVDHGKTSLLDKIRRSNVVAGEAGGITQHVGAYDVRLADGGRVVFVDTPGHEAFTQMRARGAQVTDVVVLVVAADDGVMQQTVEAINHAKAAGVPIVVAVNKIDKPGADIERVRRELGDRGLISEEWGGDTIFAYVSAKTGEGVDHLLEMLALQTEILELKANPNKAALGRIIEARLDKGRGAVATVLVQEGTLKAGDAFVCGVHAGKVRALFDDLGRRVDEAGPSIPVEVQGFTGVPEAGDDFAVMENEKAAKRIAEHRQMKKRESELASIRKLSLENILEQLKEGTVQELALVVKADVQGSVEALVDALAKLGNEQVRVQVIHAATGAITETDVMLASASHAIIIGFNVRPQGKVTEMAEAEHVEIRTYDVIYQMVDDVNKALTGLLAPEFHEEVVGRAEVRNTFSVPKIGTIAGCAVQSGKINRGALARLLRDGVVVVSTKVSSLRRFKDDVKEVLQGFECGIGLENYGDIKVGDEIEVYVIHEVAATL